MLAATFMAVPANAHLDELQQVLCSQYRPPKPQTPADLECARFYDQHREAVKRRAAAAKERKKAAEQRRLAKIKAAEDKRIAMIDAFPISDYQKKALRNRKVFLGVTTEMVIAAWGKPDHINRTVTRYGSSEQWVYPSRYLYFDDDRLTSWQATD